MMLVFTKRGIINCNTNDTSYPITRQIFNGEETFYICDNMIIRARDNGRIENLRTSEITGILSSGPQLLCKYSNGEAQEVLRINGKNMFAKVDKNGLIIGSAKTNVIYPVPELDSYQLDPSTSVFTSNRFFGVFLKVVGFNVVILTANISMPKKEIEVNRFAHAFVNPKIVACGSILVVFDSGFVHKYRPNSGFEQFPLRMDDCRYSRTNDAIIGYSGTKQSFIRSGTSVIMEEEILE